MPTMWQTNFVHVNDISPTTLLQLQHFMSQEREFAEEPALNFRSNHHDRCAQNARDSRFYGNLTYNNRAGCSGGRNTYSGSQ